MISTDRTSGAAPAVVVAGAAAALVGLYAVAVRTSAIARLDASAVSHYTYVRTPNTHVHDLVLLVLTGSLLPPLAWRLRRELRLAVRAAAAIVGSFATANALRSIVLSGPALRRDPLNGSSFPSGHAAASMASALCLVAVTPGLGETGAGIIAAAVAAAAVWAVFIPAHRPSDVVGGWLLAAACVAAVSPWTPKRGVPSAGGGRPAVGALSAAGLTVLLEAGSAYEAHRAGLSLGRLGAGYEIAVIVLAAGSVVAVYAAAGWARRGPLGWVG